MPVICPTCLATIQQANINVPKDAVFCTACGNVAALSSLVDSSNPQTVANPPPGGAWLYDDGRQMRVGAHTRSLRALFLIPIMFLWSVGSLGGIYGTQIQTGKFDLSLSAFGLFFVFGAIMGWGLVLLTIAGKVEVTISGTNARAFVGVGSFGWSRRFEAASVSSITLQNKVYGRGWLTQVIVLRTSSKSLAFGALLNRGRRNYIAHVLSSALLRSESP